MRGGDAEPDHKHYTDFYVDKNDTKMFKSAKAQLTELKEDGIFFITKSSSRPSEYTLRMFYKNEIRKTGIGVDVDDSYGMYYVWIDPNFPVTGNNIQNALHKLIERYSIYPFNKDFLHQLVSENYQPPTYINENYPNNIFLKINTKPVKK
jgi:hypothetical protein